MRVDQAPLFAVTGAVRANDPDTSREAAAFITAGVEEAILVVFGRGLELTDDDLAARLPGFFPPTVKSARSRLSKRGLLVDVGVRRLSHRGRRMIVWARR